ncbi:MAG: hypothetical protein ACYDEE_14160 [Ignavibacteriaceae bacterium]
MSNKLEYTAIFIFLLYTIVLALGSNQKYPTKIYYNNFFPYLVDKPLSEDGYYTLTVAWNIAEGKGITYNFNRPTTGIQPLSGFVFAAIAKVVIAAGGNKTTFVRAIIIFSILLEVLFFFVVKNISNALFPVLEKKWFGLSAVIATLLNFELLVYFANGLETGLYLTVLGISLLYSFYYFKGEKKFRQSIILGTLFGLCGLARIDFLAILAVLLSSNIYYKRLTIKQFFIICFTSFAVIIPWIFYIYRSTGFIFQSSARVETSWLSPGNILLRAKAMSLALMQHLTPDIYTGNKDIVLVIVFIITIITAYILLYDKRILHQFDKDNIKIFKTWSIGILFLIFVYLLYSSADYFYLRYTAPLLIIILPVFTILLALKIKRFKRKKLQIGFALVAVIFFIQAVLYFHSGRMGVQQSLRIAYIKNHFNNKAVIGCFQSGVTGYYVSNVYNLDGKMDNVVLNYTKSGRFDRFIDSTGINVILEWGDVVNMFEKNYLKKNWIEYNKNIGDNRTVCLVRKDDLGQIIINR